MKLAALLSGYNPDTVVRLPLPRIVEPARTSARENRPATMQRLTAHGIAWLRALYTQAKREQVAQELSRSLGLSHDVLRKLQLVDGAIIQRRTARALNRLYAQLEGDVPVPLGRRWLR